MKAQLLHTPGNHPGTLVHTSEIDDNYVVIGAHIDQISRNKIVNHEYIDFARLIPKDKIIKDEDHCMELVSRAGMTYFVPVSDREGSVINSFAKWEQAFRVFTDIYTREYPHRAPELVQYNQVIYLATQNFVWENVYQYNREFRIHLSKFPQRNWGIILQQVWSLFLHDRIRVDAHQAGSSGGTPRTKIKEPCWWFNVGKCNKGNSCKYEHWCTVEKCGKFGHGAHICRKRNQNQASPAVPSTAGNNPSIS